MNDPGLCESPVLYLIANPWLVWLAWATLAAIGVSIGQWRETIKGRAQLAGENVELRARLTDVSDYIASIHGHRT